MTWVPLTNYLAWQWAYRKLKLIQVHHMQGSKNKDNGRRLLTPCHAVYLYACFSCPFLPSYLLPGSLPLPLSPYPLLLSSIPLPSTLASSPLQSRPRRWRGWPLRPSVRRCAAPNQPSLPLSESRLAWENEWWFLFPNCVVMSKSGFSEFLWCFAILFFRKCIHRTWRDQEDRKHRRERGLHPSVWFTVFWAGFFAPWCAARARRSIIAEGSLFNIAGWECLKGIKGMGKWTSCVLLCL